MSNSPKKKRLIVVGPSGSGKSTLVDHLRSPEFDQHVVIPKRVITLPVRQDSDPVENRNVTQETFRGELDKGKIKPWWSRQFGDNPDDRYFYGFEKVPKRDPRLRVFLGNNAMLAATNGQIERLFRKSLVVVVTADPEIRGDRLDRRLPDMADGERASRVADGVGMLGCLRPLAVVELNTTGVPIDESQRQFTEVVMQYSAGIPAGELATAPAEAPIFA